MVDNPETVIIDTSTAHRTADGWEYGFPELTGRRARIAQAKRVANPGCHASGFIALVAPLIEHGLLASASRLTAFSLTGFSGGGKKMIAAYGEELKGQVEVEERTREAPFFNFNYKLQLYFGGRQYALAQSHKHLPEMVKVCGLATAPVFSPIVVPHYSGMEVTVSLFADQVKGGLAAVRECYCDYYTSGLVRYAEDPSEDGFLSSAALSGRDDLEVSAYGNDERLILVSRFDNLGKGASGAAIQNMNLALGVEETTGLVLG